MSALEVLSSTTYSTGLRSTTWCLTAINQRKLFSPAVAVVNELPTYRRVCLALSEWRRLKYSASLSQTTVHETPCCRSSPQMCTITARHQSAASPRHKRPGVASYLQISHPFQTPLRVQCLVELHDGRWSTSHRSCRSSWSPGWSDGPAAAQLIEDYDDTVQPPPELRATRAAYTSTCTKWSWPLSAAATTQSFPFLYHGPP